MSTPRIPVNSIARPPALRPGEKVREYLLEAAGRWGWKAGSRLPSVRQVARDVGVSTATVQSVFQRLAEEGQIRSEVGSGSFWVGHDANGSGVLRIGLNIPAPQSVKPTDWTYRIYGGILHGILKADRPIVLQSLPQEALARDDERDRFLVDSVGLDGFILFPGQFSRRLRVMHEGQGRPVVDLNPPSESATVNFVSPDYFVASRLIGKMFRASGRRRVAAVVCPPVEESVSVRLRCAGLATGLGEGLGRGATMRICEVDRRDEEAGRAVAREFFSEGGFRPDAIYCAGDSLALGVVDELRNSGIDIPGSVSIVGGNGLGLHDQASYFLTSMMHPLDVLGAELVAMLCRRVAADGGAVPGKYLAPSFHLGESTLPAENEILNRLIGQETAPSADFEMNDRIRRQ